jgi:proline dehydrogenase
MLDAISKGFFHALAGSRALKSLASSYGMRSPESFGRRFIAGETVEEAIPPARDLASRGLLLTLDLLGESVTTLDAATAAARAYIGVIDAVVAAGVERNLSLKLTQLGLDLDKAHAVDNLRRILDAAQKHEFFVRIDMENSPYTDVTLDIFETVWSLGYENCGVVLQSCLRRSERDLERVNRLGARVRLVKGAYKEPADVAFQTKAEVDAMFERMLKTLMLEGRYPAIATHDTRMIDAAKRIAAEHRIPSEKFEFQMLFGIRRDLQAGLTAQGYRMRVYVPFGREWFPYFMRRLGERPANVGFVLKGLVSDRGEGARQAR